MKKSILTFMSVLCVCVSLNAQYQHKKHHSKRKKVKDPFSYNINPKATYIPTADVNLPKGIKILGIITVNKKIRKAVIKIPGYKHSFFVKKGDVIRLLYFTKDKKKIDIYMEIKEIKSTNVLVSQKRRPDDIIVIQ